MNPTVLIADDEEDIADLIQLHLERDGIDTITVNNGLSVFQELEKRLPDLMILDVMMPNMDGFTVLKRLREVNKTKSIPVLLITAKGAESDRIRGFELGADDYIVKPFSPRELVLRVQAVLRRHQAVLQTNSLNFNGLELNHKQMKLMLDGDSIDLTVTEVKLLGLFLENQNKPLNRSFILKEVWGYNDDMVTRTLDAHVKRLREKMGSYGSFITTVRGVGYQFSSQVSS
jgi:DNA-binding response OmpR family regulator